MDIKSVIGMVNEGTGPWYTMSCDRSEREVRMVVRRLGLGTR